jgi:hypothetical protein
MLKTTFGVGCGRDRVVSRSLERSRRAMPLAVNGCLDETSSGEE